MQLHGRAESHGALRKQHFLGGRSDAGPETPLRHGQDVLRTAVDADPALPVVIMTAYGSIAEAVSAMRDGAYDFIQKPIDLEHLKHLRRAPWNAISSCARTSC